MFERLLKITERYSAALREWSTESQQHLNESKEFGTNKEAWLNCIRVVEKKLTEQSDSVAKGVKEKVIDKMTTYKNEHYGKSFIHVKKIKDFDKEFKKVQKPWLELLNKINEAKETYHTAKRKLRQAEGAAHVIETDVGSSKEQQDKAKTSVKNRTTETDTCRTRYATLIKDMEPKQKTYEADMFEILKRTDDFEKKRLEHFNSIFVSLKETILIKNEDGDLKIEKAFEEAIGKQNIKKDIDFFNKNYGCEKETKWPVFEEFEG